MRARLSKESFSAKTWTPHSCQFYHDIGLIKVHIKVFDKLNHFCWEICVVDSTLWDERNSLHKEHRNWGPPCSTFRCFQAFPCQIFRRNALQLLCAFVNHFWEALKQSLSHQQSQLLFESSFRPKKQSFFRPHTKELTCHYFSRKRCIPKWT